MTLRQVLGLLDHEVWVRVRPHGPVRDKPDIVLWSADWIGGSGYPDEVEKYLECEADDLSVELHPDPESPDGAFVSMLVVYAYTFAKPDPIEVFVLEKTSDYDGSGSKHYECRVFLDEECAKAALRDQYDSEIDARDVKPSKTSVLKDTYAWLEFVNGVTIEWTLRLLLTEDNDYK
jgi:hypothetical protein